MTPTEQAKIAGTAAAKIATMHDMRKKLALIVALILENMRLVDECNDLRRQLGMPEMKTFPIDLTRI